jgi:hypothetical protein
MTLVVASVRVFTFAISISIADSWTIVLLLVLYILNVYYDTLSVSRAS